MPQENLCLRIIPTGIKVNDSFPVQEKKQVKIFSPQPEKLLNHLIRNRLYDMDFSESRSCRSSKTKKFICRADMK